MPRDRDADVYDRLPIPMTGWGRGVVDRITLRGDERVLDAGCGTGQVTAYLMEHLPDGQVVAVDGSESMIDAARTRLGEDRVTYLVADLLEPLEVDPVDATLSTATFHWIRDHDRLFAYLAAVMRPGGRLAAQCGGAGNIANVSAAVARLGYDLERDKRFAEPEETARKLEAAGFTDVTCWLAPAPTTLPREDLARYLHTVCMGAIVDRLEPEDAEALVEEVAGAMPEPTIDYVRLNIEATRAD